MPTYAEHCNLVKTIGHRNMKCMSETKLVKQCWAILATVRVTSMCNVEKQAGELKAAGVGPTSGQCSLAAAQMSAYRRLPTTCRRRHAAAEMPTAPRLLPTSYRLSCRDANVGPMSGQRRHAAAAIRDAERGTKMGRCRPDLPIRSVHWPF